MRRLLALALVAVVAGLATPAYATTPTITDLKVHGGAGASTNKFGTHVHFRLTVKNSGPDAATDATLTMTSLSNATLQPINSAEDLVCLLPYGGDYSGFTSCSNRVPIPSGEVMKARMTVLATDATQPVVGTFCVSIDPSQSPDQVDPKPKSDCHTATYTP